MMSKAEQWFVRLNFFAIVVTFLVILAGGVVRSTGSGMGCPDWPKCFDRYIPPTSADQLPADYQQKYVDSRLKKNAKFANYLERMGRPSLAASIRQDQSIKEPEVFNVTKTWTEYGNRLIGAIAGLFLIALAIRSYIYRKTATRVFVLSILNLFIIGYQGWLGSIVVATNLTQWVVTVHMLLALVIIAILIYTFYYTKYLHREISVIMAKLPWLKSFLFLSVLVSLIQIFLGTEVREAIDAIARESERTERETWIQKAGLIFIEHRNVAVLVLVINLVIYKMVRDRFNGKAEPLRLTNFMLITLAIQVVSGFVLSYFALPPVMQAAHLLFATVLFGLQFYLFLLVNRTQTYKPRTI